MHPVKSLLHLDFRSAIGSLLLSKYADQTMDLLSAYRRWAHPDAARDNILLVCHPRGGSTWLAETLLTIPGSEMVWEPFNPQWNPSCVKAGFTWHNYISGSGLTKDQAAFTEALLKGHKVRLGHFGPLGSLERIISMALARQLLFKCTNACMMVRELREVVSLKTILLLRHPCAIVASQLSHGSWEDVDKSNSDVQADVGRVLDDYPEWRNVWNGISSQAGVLAFIWGMRTTIALEHAKESEWCVTEYESLVRSPSNEIARIFRYLDRPVPERIQEHLDTPSATTRADSNVVQGGDPLKTWRTRLTQEQVDQILKVVHRMGIDFYSSQLTPHEERLTSWTQRSPGSFDS